MKENNNFSQQLLNVGIEHKGSNFVIDKGMPPFIFESYVESLSQHVQLIKLGWTTWSLFQDKELRQKLTSAEKRDIPVCLGGTLFEITYRQGIYADLLKFLGDMNINSIEIGNGFAVDPKEVPAAVELAKNEGLKVMVEVGYKDQQKDEALTIDERIHHIKTARDSGADFVVLEAREIGAGYSVFKKDADENQNLIDSILNVLPLEQIIFEAPSRNNQISLVNSLGPDIIMGNIPFEEIPRVETIRRGLHADTYETIQSLKKGL